MHRRAAKRDDNEQEIVDVLLAVGCSVSRIYDDDGFPDLVVGRPMANYILEVKVRGKGKLTDKQKEWHARWKGPKVIVFDWYEALVAVGLKRVAQMRAQQLNYEVKISE
jgi:hypothetical protein